ncbi:MULTISPECIES: hypothetical protein [Micromonospora]|uniref:hypothetical protein n=1 Tax=Micromonospora TaxID=1873 RepID=UPI00248AA977|nr:hypothetical protein [Micromonospora sp. WMMC264]WBB85334.1 hypothetical protein O7542_29190 [Micromonospora sp. WMMC264]
MDPPLPPFPAPNNFRDTTSLPTDHVSMTREEALANLHDTVAFWSIGSATSVDVVRAACDCLVAGVDSPTLRILAGVSPVKGSEDDELRRWLADAFAELSLTYYGEESRKAEEEVLRIMARRLLARKIAPRELTSWVSQFITYAGTPLAGELINLESAYEYVEAANEVHMLVSTKPEDLDAEVIAEARRLVGDSGAGRDQG